MTKKQLTKLEQRFWENIKVISGSRPTPCYEWQGSKDADGYGQLKVEGKNRVAHHVYFFLEQGEWPSFVKGGSYQLNHMCLNKGCVRHCYLGTQKQNIQDRERDGNTAKGDRHWSRTRPERVARGERHYSAKLTEKDIPEVFRLSIKEGWSQKRIGNKLGVSQPGISRVLSGKTWAWLKRRLK